MKTLFLIVNYNSSEEVFRLVRSLIDSLGQSPASAMEVVVIDNSFNFDIEQLSGCLPLQGSNFSIKCHRPIFNLGFYNSAHSYLALRSEYDFDYLVVSNPDIIVGRSFFFDLCSLAFDGPRIIAPSILSPDGDQNPQIRIKPSPRHFRLLCFVYSSPFLFALYDLASKAKGRILSVFKTSAANKSSLPPLSLESEFRYERIYAPHGSFVVFNKRAFVAGIDLRHFSFLFGETLMIAEDAISLGIDIVFVPALRVFHSRHASTRKIFRDPRIVRSQYHAARFFLDHFFRRS